MPATFGLYAPDARNGNVQRSRTAAQNATALQAMIDGFSSTGGTIFIREPYPCNPITLRQNVSLIGDTPRFKGPKPYGGGSPASNSIPADGGFLITDTGSPFISLEGMNNVANLTFFYPSQNYAATTVASTTSYKPTIANASSSSMWNIGLSGLCFVGATHCMDLDYISISELADVAVDLCYGYPLGGYFLRVNAVRDILRVTRCHANPSVGSRFMVNVDVNSPFPYALLDDVITHGMAMFDINDADQFELSQNFVFGAKTAFKATGAYGHFTQCDGDEVETAFDLSPGANWKSVHIEQSICIISAGPTPSARNLCRVRSDGHVVLSQVWGRTGTNSAVPSSNAPSANALLLVDSGANVSGQVIGCGQISQSGSWADFVINNGSGIIYTPTLEVA